jgi:hypothetical protein
MRIGRGYGWRRRRSRKKAAGIEADIDAEYIATPSGYPTPEAAVAFIKQMIDSPSTTIKGPKSIQ